MNFIWAITFLNPWFIEQVSPSLVQAGEDSGLLSGNVHAQNFIHTVCPE